MKTKIIIELKKGDEILEKEVKPFGSASGHILIPKKHTGKRQK